LLEFLNLRFELSQNIFPFVSQLGQGVEITQIPGQPGIQLDILFQPTAHLQGGLRFLLSIPEFGLSYLLFKLENSCTLMFYIKDNLESDAPWRRLQLFFRAILRALNPPKN
jgi:hypothetical protein